MHDLLEEAGTTFDRWVTVNTLATRGPAIARDALRRDLAEGLGADDASVAGLLDQLEADGLIQLAGGTDEGDRAPVELTIGGQAFHRSLRESIGRLTARVVGGLDAGQLQTTIRVLREVTGRARELRSEPIPG